MPEINISLISSESVAAILYTIITLTFLIVPFIIYSVRKNDSSKLIEKYMQVFPNPNQAMEAYYRDKENYNIVEPYRVNSIIAIAFYFLVMFILSEFISAIAIIIYLKANGFSKDIIDPSKDAFNENVYNHMSTFLSPLLQIIIYAIITIGAVIILWKPLKKDLNTMTKATFGYGAMGFGITMAAQLVGGILFEVLGVTGFKGEASNQEAIEAIFNSSISAIVMLFFVTVIMAPIVEELIFRKCIFTIVKDSKLAAIISALIFGGLHVVSSTIMVGFSWLSGEATYFDVVLEFIYIIQYSLMGVGFCIAYIKSNKNVVSTIFAHMLNNAASFMSMLLVMLLPEEYLQIVGSIFTFLF